MQIIYAVALGEDIQTVEDVYEPFLIQKGLLARTPRGRKVTKLAYEQLNIKTPPYLASQASLF